MKEKTAAIITLGCIFSLFFYYKIFSPNHHEVAMNNAFSVDDVVEQLVEKVESENVENQISESPVNADQFSNDQKSECSLIQSETDAMTFPDSFKYYRECNGKGAFFTWKNNEYSTLLASEILPAQNDQTLADKSASPNKTVELHHLDLHKEVLGTTVGNK